MSTTTKQQATQAANTSLKSQNNVETTNQKQYLLKNTAQKQSNSVTTYQGRVGGMGSSATKAQTAKSTSGFTGFRKAVSTYKATSSLPKYKPQVNSSINDYIRKNNIQAPKIEEDYTSYFLNMAIEMVLENLKALWCMIQQTIILLSMVKLLS